MWTAKTGRMPRLIWVFAGRTLFCWFCHVAAHLSYYSSPVWKIEYFMWDHCMTMECNQLDPDVLPVPTPSDIQKNINFTSPISLAYTVLNALSIVDYRLHFGVSLNLPVRKSDMTKFAAAVKTVWNSTRGRYSKLSHITRKPVFLTRYDSNPGRYDRPAFSATEASYSLGISDIETRGIILSRQPITKMPIRLREYAGWSASLLFAYGINRFSRDVAQLKIRFRGAKFVKSKISRIRKR